MKMFKLLMTLFVMLWCSHSWAYACYSDNPPTYTYNMGTKTITNPDDNKAGQTYPNAYTWNFGATSLVNCDCPGTQQGGFYFSTSTDLPLGHISGSQQYYKVNDNLEVSTALWQEGTVNRYINTPWHNEYDYSDVVPNYPCKSLNLGSGSRGMLSLYIAKPFIGSSSFSKLILRLYMNKYPSDPLTSPVSMVAINGSVVVPQNCTINAGQTITVDFGTMLSSAFKTAGEKPTGMTDKSFNVPIKCANTDASANLALRITATAASGNATAIASNNEDVGVVVTSEQGNVLTPNNKSSAVPFNVDSSGNASVTLKAYPISTTGKQPKEGLFTALATLVIDFA